MLRTRATPKISISEMPSLDVTELSTNSIKLQYCCIYQTTDLDRPGRAIVMVNGEPYGDLKPSLKRSIMSMTIIGWRYRWRRG